MPGINMMPSGSTLQIPLDAPTSFTAEAGNAEVTLTWTDPNDKYATPEGETAQDPDQLVSVWSHTVLVRKTGSQPAGPNDGTVVVSSSVRNQYQTTGYVDSGLTNDTTYYYGVFAYNEDGVVSPGAFANATPIAGTPLSKLAEGTLIKILENGSPVEFYLAKHNYEPGLNGQGRELVVRKNVAGNVRWDADNGDVYASSTIDSYFNGTYKSVFSQAVQALIGTTTFSVWGSTATKSVFTPSLTEYGLEGEETAGGMHIYVEGSAISFLTSRDIRNKGVFYWTRTALRGRHEKWACLVDSAGNIGSAGALVGNYYPTIPCFTLPSTATVDEDLNLMES